MNKDLKNRFREIVGSGHFTDEPEDLVCYAYDATKDHYLPEAVLFPAGVEEVSAVLELADRSRVPVVPRGAGSGFSGGALAVRGGLVMVMNRLNRILSIDKENLVAVVEPAVITAAFQSAVKKEGLFYPPDPASHTFSTLGGNIAENAGGMSAVKYGVTKDYVRGLQVVLASGEVVHTGSACAKDVVGYDLTTLFVGSEGTLGVVTRATLRLLPLPEARKTLTAAFAAMDDAARTVSAVIGSGIVPSTLEFLDAASIAAVERHVRLGLPPSAGAFLLIEVDGDADGLHRTLERVERICRNHSALEVRVAGDPSEQEELWRARRAVSPALRAVSGFRINEDIVVPRSKIPEMIRRIQATADRYALPIVNFGHAGDGNIHVTVMAGPAGEADLPKMRSAAADVFAAAVELGGRISGEHGIGLSKKPYIGLNLDPATLNLCRRLKQTLDPNNILNPGKMFP